MLAIDLIDLPQLAAIFEAAGFYVSGMDDVIANRMSSFQVIQIETISRADLIVANSTEYSRIQLSRRKTIPISTGKDVYFASPQDVIINKLLWGKSSQSQKQWRDVLSIMKDQQESLDYGYIGEWADRFGVTVDYLRATVEAGVRDYLRSPPVTLVPK